MIFIGEKTSLGSVLRPIAEMVGGVLLLPTGEISDTLIHGMAKAAAADNRPAVVFYFSDFDPAGNQMPVSVARKLQALRHLYFQDTLDIQLHHVALTLDQVKHYGLPSTPLKEGDRRAEKWRKKMGHEVTEIDALLALHPQELRQIALQAIRPFYDSSLAYRVRQAEKEWRIEANATLTSRPDYDAAKRELGEALEGLKSGTDRLKLSQARVRKIAEDLELPKPEVPEPGLPDARPTPLFSTDEDYIPATFRLRNHKALDADD